VTTESGYVQPPEKQPRKRSALRLRLLGVAAAASLAGIVSLASGAFAHTTQAPSATPLAPASAPASEPWHGPTHGEPHGGLGSKDGFGRVLHGQFVTAKEGGGYQTIDVQQGQVTAVSSTSITVKSQDGFTQSYAVTADTQVAAQKQGISSIKAGDTVALRATVEGGTATATHIADRTQLGTAHPKPSPTS
jgi:hypothetical protein